MNQNYPRMMYGVSGPMKDVGTTRSSRLFTIRFKHACVTGVSAIRNHPKRIESFAEALTIRGVGPKTAQKVCV